MAAPRLSASILIINHKSEVLLVQRNPRSSAFAGFHVFPGGNYDAKQDNGNLKMTAIREAFEESGILIASGKNSTPKDSILDQARIDVHSQKRTFSAFLEEHQLKADTENCLPFTTWVTPVIVPRRFRTEFYITFLPQTTSTFSSGHQNQRIPTPDGGLEVISARFVHPSVALAEFSAGKITLMPPQFYLMTTLLEANGRERVEELARGAFGRMVINPIITTERDEEGRGMLLYEGDEKRGGKQGTLHRALMTGSGGMPTALWLRRNFDIFTQVEEALGTSDEKPKL